MSCPKVFLIANKNIKCEVKLEVKYEVEAGKLNF